LGEGAAASGDRHKFSPVATTNIPSAVQSVCSGTDHSIALLIDGSIVGWGQGDQGKLGFNVEYGVFATPNTPNFVGTSGKTSLGIVKSISAGRNQTAILNKDGEYWAMGNKINGALGIETGTPNRETQLRYITNNVNSVATGLNYILLIKTDGSMWISGEGAYGKLGTSSTSNVPKLKENTAIDHNNLAVFAGKNNHSMVLKKDHRVMAAGANSHGQLGNGNTKQQEFWTVVIDDEKNELTGAATISLGENHSMILKNDGTLWAMGRNSELQLGTASTLNHLTAVKVLDDVAYVAAGYYHTLAVKQDGSLWAAGSNQYGQFGQTASSKNSVWTQIDISAITPPPVSTQPANP
jgi:alpha-tubulin suppressor-like RCC1 family protein